MSFALEYVNKYPESSEKKQLIEFEMPRLKKRMLVTGALAVLSATVAIVAIAIIPLIGQVLFGAFMTLAAISGADSYLSFKRRSALAEMVPAQPPSLASKVVSSVVSTLI